MRARGRRSFRCGTPTDTTSPSVRSIRRDRPSKARLVGWLPARAPIQHIKMNHWQAEPLPELQGETGPAAALAPSNDGWADGECSRWNRDGAIELSASLGSGFGDASSSGRK